MENGEKMTENSEELRTKKVDFGIDLGTTTSIIAHCEGGDTPIIPNLISNRNFTPSAVAIDEDGNIDVGESAKRQSLLDSKNAAAEFKLKMGMNYKYHFEDSGMDLLPEELSAEVLKELKNSVYKQLDKKINSAVITVPADFSPIKIKATEKAAKLAGFEFSPIIMEPVAAAYAYSNYLDENGTWLMYDLGGGTFDVSIVKLEDDDFLNLSHSGDERLGGNLIDWDIVYKIFAKKVSDDLGLTDFNKKEKKYEKAFAKLKGAAEEAKKDLSNSDRAKAFVDALLVHDGEIYDFKYTLTKDELEEIMTPYIKRTINHCNDALKKAKLNTSDIDYIVLVGGSTLSPVIRENIEKEFDIPLKYDIDPTTVVAKGAALFAGTIPDPSTGKFREDSFGLKLDYEATGPMDEEFYVTGEVISDKVDDFDGFTIEVINIKTKRSTGKISVEDDGYFEFELIPEDKINKYSINLYDSTGSLVELDENSANAIEYEVKPNQKIILPHTLGLGLADDTLFVLAKEGSLLPYHNMEPFKTTSEVTQGDASTYLSMPLYNGTAKVASNNEQVGELLISGDDVKKTILKNSEITITVDIDESRNMQFDVKVLDTGEKFPFNLCDDIPTVDPNIVKRKFIDAKDKYRNYKSEYGSGDNEEIKTYLNQIEEENIIENISDFIENAENDEDELYQADKLIKKLNEILNNIDAICGEKEKIGKIQIIREQVRKTVEKNGSYECQEKFDRISDEIDEAIENEDYIKIEQLESALMEMEINCGDPCEKMKEALVFLIMMAEYDDEDADLVNELKQEGMKAISNEDCPAMANIGQQLMNLMKDGSGRDGPGVFPVGGGVIRD